MALNVKALWNKIKLYARKCKAIGSNFDISQVLYWTQSPGAFPEMLPKSVQWVTITLGYFSKMPVALE